MPVFKPLALLLAVWVALACGCEAQPETEAAPQSTSSPAIEPPPAEPPPPGEPPPPAEPELLSGVGPSGAEGRSARRQAALDLLTDGDSASSLPIYATDPGKKFDSQLAEKLTPKVWISGRSSSGPVPTIKSGPATVEGGLDRDIIRRIARAHINEVRSCYNAGLKRNPKLEGRVTIEFQILASGKVSSSSVKQSTVSDETVGNCIAKAFKRWTFPKPRGGGVVDVVFPFDLSTSPQ